MRFLLGSNSLYMYMYVCLDENESFTFFCSANINYKREFSLALHTQSNSLVIKQFHVANIIEACFCKHLHPLHLYTYTSSSNRSYNQTTSIRIDFHLHFVSSTLIQFLIEVLTSIKYDSINQSTQINIKSSQY